MMDSVEIFGVVVPKRFWFWFWFFAGTFSLMGMFVLGVAVGVYRFFPYQLLADTWNKVFSEPDNSFAAEGTVPESVEFASFFEYPNQIHVKKLNFYEGEDIVVVVTNPSNLVQLVIADVGGGRRDLDHTVARFNRVQTGTKFLFWYAFH